MLNIKNLTLYLKHDLRTLVKDFSFSPGVQNKKIALIGEEGNGKSTLLKAIYDPELIRPYAEMSGEIYRAGEVIGYLPQEIGANWGDLSASELLFAKEAADGFDYALYYELLGRLSLDDGLLRDNVRAETLSGGEKIKLALLLELMKRPDILLLDEPGNDLDLASMALLEDFICETDKTVIFISHDERLLERCADTIIHFEQLIHKRVPVHTIASLPYRDYIEQKSLAFDRQTQIANKEAEEYRKKMERWREIYEKVQTALNNVSRKDPAGGKNLKDKMRSVKAQGRRFEKEQSRAFKKPVAEDPINISFDEDIRIPSKQVILDLDLPELRAGERLLARNIKLSIRGAEKVCIVGANGSGKSTLLRHVLDELRQARVKCGYMPQVYDERLDLERSPLEFLSTDFTGEEETAVRTYLGSLNFTPEEMLRPIAGLSGGQKAKLYFAKMIFERDEFLILDEPTRNLSPLSGPEIRRALEDFPGGILAVSHDRVFIDEVFEAVYELKSEGLFRLR